MAPSPASASRLGVRGTTDDVISGSAYEEGAREAYTPKLVRRLSETEKEGEILQMISYGMPVTQTERE